MTNNDQQFPRDYKRLHGAPYDPDPGVAAYLAFIGLILIIAAITLIFSTLA